jgi:hypothetical protein
MTITSIPASFPMSSSALSVSTDEAISTSRMMMIGMKYCLNGSGRFFRSTRNRKGRREKWR